MDLKRNIFVGIVEENVDINKLGRIKVRVQDVFDEIPLDHIPWASPYKVSDGRSFSVPPLGKIVNVIFDDGVIYHPYYIYTDNYNINLQDKLESLSDEEYTDFVALLFDHRTRIYSETDGLTIDYLINKIKLTNESINLELKDNDNKLMLGTASANQSAVLGDHFIMDWFKEFMNLMSNPANMIGNLAAPILKPAIDAHIQIFLANPEKFISSNVFIVDNDSVDTLERDSITSEVEHDDITMVSPDTDTAGVGVNEESASGVSDSTKKRILEEQEKEKDMLEKAKPKDGNDVGEESTTSKTNSNSVGSFSSPNSAKKRNSTNQNSKYSSVNRGRTDALDSSIVKDRDNSGSNTSTKRSNPNYGSYN